MNKRREAVGRRETTRAEREGDGERRASFSERDGVLVARDPRLFRPGREPFIRRLAGAASRQRDVRRVQVCLASGTCRIEFAAGRVSPPEMASRFAESVHAALSPGPADGGPGRDHGWTALTLFPAGEAGSVWETTREGQGELGLWNQDLHRDRGLVRRVARELRSTPGVASCRTTLWSGDLQIRFDPAVTSAGGVVSAAEDAFRRALRPAKDPRTADGPGTPAVMTGLRRVWYLALAGGSFGLTLVALVVPGIPTVPFLLATSYYLVRSSPVLNRRLLRSRFFGPILEDLQAHGGLRRANKLKLIGLALALGAVVLVFVGAPAGLLLVVVASLTVSVYAVARIPGLPSSSEPAPPPRPALAGPVA